jgi:hypothetical protein
MPLRSGEASMKALGVSLPADLENLQARVLPAVGQVQEP